MGRNKIWRRKHPLYLFFYVPLPPKDVSVIISPRDNSGEGVNENKVEPAS